MERLPRPHQSRRRLSKEFGNDRLRVARAYCLFVLHSAIAHAIGVTVNSSAEARCMLGARQAHAAQSYKQPPHMVESEASNSDKQCAHFCNEVRGQWRT